MKKLLNVLRKPFDIFSENLKDSIGRDDLREKVWRWDWNHHALLISHMEGKFVTRIMSSERAERGGRKDKLGYSALRKRVASCVKTLHNGDVIIKNIPMINQGAKGYCSPATWERYLRYLTFQPICISSPWLPTPLQAVEPTHMKSKRRAHPYYPLMDAIS